MAWHHEQAMCQPLSPEAHTQLHVVVPQRLAAALWTRCRADHDGLNWVHDARHLSFAMYHECPSWCHGSREWANGIGAGQSMTARIRSMVLGISHLLCTMDAYNVHMSITQQTSEGPWDVQKDPKEHLHSLKIEVPLDHKKTVCQTACHMVHTFLGVHCSMETGNGPV
jgi:hypothetical protein